MKIRTNSWELNVSVSEDILTLELFHDSSFTLIPLSSVERIDSFKSKVPSGCEFAVQGITAPALSTGSYGGFQVVVKGSASLLTLNLDSSIEAKDVVLRLGYAAFSSTELQDLNLVR